MIAPAILIAFFVGIALEALFLAVTDHRARAIEQAFWSDLRADALHDYGRLFDWEREGDL